MLTVILAGGESRRMGRDKAMLPYAGSSMLQSLIDRYAVLGPVAVCVDRPGRFPLTGAAELTDPRPGQGPLNGILAGFQQTEATELFLTATDLPCGDASLARLLAEMRGDCDACLLCGPRGPEPMFGIYGRAALEAAEEALAAGRRSMHAMLARMRVRYLNQEKLPGFDLTAILQNINTPEDYQNLNQRNCLT